MPQSSSGQIVIEDVYHYHGKAIFGLLVECRGPQFPLVVGCSVKTRGGGIIDMPARKILSAGLALWELEAPSECAIKTGSFPPVDHWEGQVIFALWKDESFQERLADTGWVSWETQWLIGASTAGLDMQDENIASKYGARLRVWEPLP